MPYKFFTHGIQFAFGHGGDHASYVSAKYNSLSVVGQAGFALAAGGIRWTLFGAIGMRAWPFIFIALLLLRSEDPANAWTNVSRAGTFTLDGATPAPATGVTVNGQPAQLYGDLTFARTNLTLTTGINIFTTIARFVYGTTTTNMVTVNLPQSVNLGFDNNGNLTNDGLKTFAYDSENQLTNVTLPGAWKSEYVYDGLNRRRINRDYIWQTNAWVKTNETRIIYDERLPIQERNTNDVPLVTYTRGLDLSGSLNGAGGIGGLLARTDANGSVYYHADGSGNITALVDGSENILGRYLYSPLGKPIGMWGPMAPANVMQFSSEPRYHDFDDFGLRWHSSDLDRWLNQDPIGERGGLNLYGFVGNNPVNFVDPFGLAFGDWWDPRSYSPAYAQVQGQQATQAQLSAAGCDSMQEFQLDHPGYGGTMTAGDTSAVQAGAGVASEMGNGYMQAAMMVTPGGAEEEAGANLLSDAARAVKCPNWKSVPKFGHFFLEHGAGRPLQQLIDRARQFGPQGRWPDNDKAAQFLADYVDKLPQPLSVPLPPGLGQIVNADGTVVNATRAMIVPKPGGGLRTAYPMP